jgi:copper(I)-binding protein
MRGRLAVATAVAVSGGVIALVGPSAPVGASYHGASGRPATATGTRLGALTVVEAFLPQPASPDVAAIYLTVKNSGARADELVSVSSAAAGSSMLMTENANGTMGMLRTLRIPAHGSASLVPGRDHVMLEQPRGTLDVGQHVAVSLHFRLAGTLTISVPVVPLSWIATHR